MEFFNCDRPVYALLRTCRSEAAILTEKMSDLWAKLMLWVAQTKTFARAEAQALLHKVDAANDQVFQLERKLAESRKHIRALEMGKRELFLQIGRMVPVSELLASQAEVSKLQEDIKGLNQLLKMAQRENEDIKPSIKVYFFLSLNFICAVY